MPRTQASDNAPAEIDEFDSLTAAERRQLAELVDEIRGKHAQLMPTTAVDVAEGRPHTLWVPVGSVLPPDGVTVLLLSARRTRVYFARWNAARNGFVTAIRADAPFSGYKAAAEDMWGLLP